MPFGPTVLDISEEEIKLEHFKSHLKAPTPEKEVAKHRDVTGVVVGSVVTAVVVIVTTIMTAIVVFWRCKRKNSEKSVLVAEYAPERKRNKREGGLQKKRAKGRMSEDSTPCGKSKPGGRNKDTQGIQGGKDREEWETPHGKVEAWETPRSKGMENKSKTRRRSTPKGKGGGRSAWKNEGEGSTVQKVLKE